MSCNLYHLLSYMGYAEMDHAKEEEDSTGCIPLMTNPLIHQRATTVFKHNHYLAFLIQQKCSITICTLSFTTQAVHKFHPLRVLSRLAHSNQQHSRAACNQFIATALLFQVFFSIADTLYL